MKNIIVLSMFILALSVAPFAHADEHEEIGKAESICFEKIKDLPDDQKANIFRRCIDDPIEININIEFDNKSRVQIEHEIENTIDNNKEIF